MTTKRFIAGAVCPSCGALDTTRMYRTETGQEFRECVDCGFSDGMNAGPKLEGALPEARIAREEIVLADDTEVVRILDSQ